MISMATISSQRDAITFTDKTMETGIVLRMFLDAIYTDTVDGVGESDYTEWIKNLIRFAKKWDCPQILTMVGQGIQLNLEVGQEDLFDQFFLAIELDDYELAAACLRYRPVMNWDGMNDKADQEIRSFTEIGSLSQNVFEISATPYVSYCRVEPEIAWALLRSANVANLTQNGKHFEENYGDEFLKLMRIQCEYFPDDVMVF